MNSRERSSLSYFFENGSYKVVALVVATVLWVTMQGRKDTVLTRDIEMQVLWSPGKEAADSASIPKTVRVEISGPRVALKKFSESATPLIVDLRGARSGPQVVHVTREGLALPLGAKVLSLQPSEFTAMIVDIEAKKQGAGGVKEQNDR